MDLSMKFKMTSSCQTIKIPSLKIDRSYNIERAEKVRTKYGEAVLLTLQDSPLTSVKIFLPRRYGELFTEEDFQPINEKKKQFHGPLSTGVLAPCQMPTF